MNERAALAGEQVAGRSVKGSSAMNLTDLPSDLIDRLNSLEPHLRDVFRGQNHVIPRVASVLHRGELGFTKTNRPKGSFLFLGPTGVGKTELTLAFTRYLFGEKKLLRFDMSEFQTQESLAVLLGGSLGEEGTLELAVKRAGFGTLLFDESEKAHPRVLDILLQILDAARITVATGETLDLSGFYVVLTSNLGAADVMQLQHAPLATMERHVLSKAQRSFRPELFARITEKLVFGRLSYDIQLEIAQQILASELLFLEERGITLSCSSAVLPFLVQRGFHPRLGARPMRDAVEKHIRDAASRACLEKCVSAEAELVVHQAALCFRSGGAAEFAFPGRESECAVEREPAAVG
jgi:ATP-dependent Clp protease ATP-binding subunit ClpB